MLNPVPFDSREYWERQANDLSRALAAVMRHMGIHAGRFEEWEIYECESWGADALEVDEKGHRVPYSPVWIDYMENLIAKNGTNNYGSEESDSQTEF